MIEAIPVKALSHSFFDFLFEFPNATAGVRRGPRGKEALAGNQSGMPGGGPRGKSVGGKSVDQCAGGH